MTFKIALRAQTLSVVTAAFLAIVCNVPLWSFTMAQQGFALTLRCAAIVFAAYVCMLGLVALPRVQKPVIALLLLIAASVSYFISKYGVFIDSNMIRNAAQTDRAEVADLMGLSFALWMAGFFVLPLVLLWRAEVIYPARGVAAAVQYARLPLLAALVALAVLWSGMQQLAPFYRNHREVRHMITPYNALAASIKYARSDVLPRQQTSPRLATPSRRAARTQGEARRVVVFVVGETARAANFSLGGYHRVTNPRLQARSDIVYFEQFTACGTHTAFSVPCMFSSLGRKDFTLARFDGSDNLLSLVANAGVPAVWVDNNSGCKGVCDGIEIIREDALAKTYPQYCHKGECYDEALVAALRAALARKGDLFIVLHQKGSHGPLYHKRAPDSFAQFQPVCRQADLGKCTRAQIVNAYDNSILYADHVLDAVIGALAHEPAAAVLYASDHGESLGEKGMYLHGAPYILAPSEQTHIPAMLWLSQGMRQAQDVSQDCLAAQGALPFSHDNIFATLLELNGVETAALKPADSLLAACKRRQTAGALAPAATAPALQE